MDATPTTAVLEEFVQLLLEYGGELELGRAVSLLSQRSRRLVSDYGALKFVERFSQLFSTRRGVRRRKSKVMVKLDVPLDFCPQAGENGGCGDRGCNLLHLCPFFVKESCKLGDKCKRSHNYRDEHTIRVLRHFRLGFLNSSLLQKILKMIVDEGEIQRAATNRSVPDICKFYNEAICKKGELCPWLHVCEHFVDGDCKFGSRCKRDHDFSDEHNIRVLEEYDMDGFDDRYVLQRLKGRERKRTLSASSRSSDEGRRINKDDIGKQNFFQHVVQFGLVPQGKLNGSLNVTVPIHSEETAVAETHKRDEVEVVEEVQSEAKTSGDITAKVMKKKKQKRLKDIEKRCSDKGNDLMGAYTERLAQEEVPKDSKEPAVEETQQKVEEVIEEVQSEEETWEDKEDLDGESDMSRLDGGRLTYERDFLLQWQTNPMCMLKPEGLPDLECGQARVPFKSGYQQNKMPKTDGGVNMFLPAYLRQNSRNNQSNQRAGGRDRNVQPKKVIDLAPADVGSEQLRRTEKRWARPSEAAKDGNEEDQKTETNNMQMDDNFGQDWGGIENIRERELLETTSGNHMELPSQDSTVPAEIIARGHLALKSYNKALIEGKTCVKRLPVMFIGHEGTGKTSLKKSLKGEAFDANEGSTDGIEVDPSYFNVSAEIWKTGERNEETESESGISFECRAAAQLIFNSLKEEENSVNVPESLVAEHDIAFGPDSEEPSSSTTKSLVVDNERTFQSSVEPNTGSSESLFVDQSIAASGLSDKTITDSGNDSVTEETTRKTEVYVPFESKEVNYSHLFVPELPEDIATLVEKLLEEDERKEDEEIFSVLWDFGGQSVYYSTHPIFLSAKAIYILVCDLSRDPRAKAKPLVRKGMFKNKEDICCNKTNLDYLDFWLSSVYSLISSDDTREKSAMSETLLTRLPPVFFVCTHADEPYDRCTHSRDLALEIYGFLRNKTYREHLFKDVFVVDNRKSGSKQECAEVIRLRDEILAVAKELPQMKKEIPLRWLRYETALQLLCKEQYKWIPLTDAKQLAFDVCRIDDEVEFQTLLNFLHDQRILIHFNGTPELERMVILDPQWLIDVFKMVITVKRYEHEDRKVEELWRKLEETGILDENLQEHVWSSLFHNHETRESLTAIMERFSLLCLWPSNSDSSKQYLVPSMLPSPPTDAVRKLLAAVQIPSLCVKFTSGRVPPGLFPRLILQFFQWCNEVWKSEMMPQLFQNFAMFHILPDQGTAVIFLCHPSFIEVSFHSGNNDIEETADFEDGSSDVTAASRTICSKLRLMFESMRKEFPWLENISYEMCVRCLVCSRSGTVNYCHTHDMPGCSQEECLHFVSDSELQKCRKFYICTRPGVQGDCRIHVRQYAPYWFGFLDEKESGFSLNQDTANGDKEKRPLSNEGNKKEAGEEQALALPCAVRQEAFLSQPSDDDSRDIMVRLQELQLKQTSLENPEPGEEQALALPSAVEAALLSQSSDAQDVVARLQEDLQLKQVSLKNPEPETKKMIRSLARKAKCSDRLDVVKHLREVTPAGTTGPLLHENLDVQNIPLQQSRDLTVHLCGGDEWMRVAERLGLTPAQIRFLERRCLNPLEYAIGHIRSQRDLNVGQLYDVVVDCGFPTFADLL